MRVESLLSSLVLVLILGLGPSAGMAQDAEPGASEADDVHYYDGWPGAWHRIDGGRIDSLPTFVVRRGPGNSFLED